MQGAWADLDAYAQRGVTYPGGKVLPIDMIAVDAGYHTDAAQAFCSRRPNRLAIFGRDGWHRPILGRGEAISFAKQGKRAGQASKRADERAYIVGTFTAKATWYGFPPLDAGLCQGAGRRRDRDRQAGRPRALQPRHGRRMVRHGDRRSGHRQDRQRLSEAVWQPLPGRENHYLDCRVYNMAAAEKLLLDTLADRDWQRLRPNATRRKTPPRATCWRRREDRNRPTCGTAAAEGGDWVPPKKDWLG
jgi:phage terminase large subunit GpA-like protein